MQLPSCLRKPLPKFVQVASAGMAFSMTPQYCCGQGNWDSSYKPHGGCANNVCARCNTLYGIGGKKLKGNKPLCFACTHNTATSQAADLATIEAIAWAKVSRDCCKKCRKVYDASSSSLIDNSAFALDMHKCTKKPGDTCYVIEGDWNYCGGRIADENAWKDATDYGGHASKTAQRDSAWNVAGCPGGSSYDARCNKCGDRTDCAGKCETCWNAATTSNGGRNTNIYWGQCNNMNYPVTGAPGYNDSPDGYRPDINAECASTASVTATFNTLVAKLKGCLNYHQGTAGLLQQAQGEHHSGTNNGHCPWGVDDTGTARQWDYVDGHCRCPCLDSQSEEEEEQEQTSLAQLKDNSTRSDDLLNLLADAVVQGTETKVRL